MKIDRSSTSNRQDQSSLECRLEHIPIYSWIESNFTTLRINLVKRGLNEHEIHEKEQTMMNNLKVKTSLSLSSASSSPIQSRSSLDILTKFN